VTSNIVNQTPYLRTTRSFPQDPQALQVEVDKSYLDIANVVNARTIGLFPTGRPAINGEAWFLQGNKKQQGQRQIFQFSDSNLIFNLGPDINSVTNFTRIWGTFFDGTYWQTLPYVDVTNVTNQINVKVSATQVIITKGGGSPPSMSKGLLILEWIVNT